MTTLEIPQGTRWSDRFDHPDLKTLLQEIGPDLQEPFDMVRQSLLSRNLTEDLGWHGPTYRWSLAYDAPGTDKPNFYLVPRPTYPMLAAPISIERLAEIKTSKLDRAVRERIMHASVVGPVAWCMWVIGSKAGATALINGIKLIWDKPA